MFESDSVLDKNHNELKENTMRHILYYIAAAIIVIWAISIIFYSLGFIIHTLLVVAAVLIIIRVAQGKKIIDD